MSEPRTWLLLIHQVPAKPDYLRVKVGRRLHRVGDHKAFVEDGFELTADMLMERKSAVGGAGCLPGRGLPRLVSLSHQAFTLCTKVLHTRHCRLLLKTWPPLVWMAASCSRNNGTSCP